jgi:TniQ
MSNRAMQPDACSLPPRSGTLPRPLSFPILTLDESKLAPALGYLFNSKWLDPYESLISILWKFEKANALPGIVVARLIRPDIDPDDGFAPQLGEVDVGRLHDVLGLPTKALRAALLERTERRRRYSDVFRHCRHCIARGYHSVLHQIESVTHCPAHRCGLESMCRRCGRQAPYYVGVQLLEAPYRCPYCRERSGGQGWRPSKARPMQLEQRRAFTRLYLERCSG